MKKRGSFEIVRRLLGLVKSLAPVMCLAILAGCVGYFCAAFITTLGGYAMLSVLGAVDSSLRIILVALMVIAIMRGVFHYLEQYCNHFIAFKLLALIRDKVFASLRRLAPAKLDRADRGNLVSVITSDIELLEVFYAHTISPICIAVITSVTVVGFIASFHPVLGGVALLGHITVGVVVPLVMSKNSESSAAQHRKKNGELNSYFLDSLRGIKEVLQYRYAENRKDGVAQLSAEMEEANSTLKKNIAKTSFFTYLLILSFSSAMLFTAAALYRMQLIDISAVILPSILLFSSFGAVTATANLGAGLAQTLASANRVLDILDEKPLVHEVEDGIDIAFEGAQLKDVSFAYDEQLILDGFSLEIEKGKILGVSGRSGSGKSTILKLLMRFRDVQQGCVYISGEDIKGINTKSLRASQSFVTQETYVFCDNFENNIKVADITAERSDVVDACKKASLHEFIQSLPQGYDTHLGEMGSRLSGGEKQRIGMARAFLHKADFILLDEPTSNLDSLNEGIILHSLKQAEGKTIVLVSHRESTMNVSDKKIHIDSARSS